MAPPSPLAAAFAFPAGDMPLDTREAVLFAAVVLFLAGLSAMVRSALLHSVPARVLARAGSEEERARLEPLLERADSLRTSASTLTVTFQLLFLGVVMGLAFQEGFTWPRAAVVVGVSVPLLVFVCEVLPATLRGSKHDRLLVRFLPAFHLLQIPLAAPVYGLEITRRWTMRLLRIKEKPAAAREIIEELRDVIEESDLKGDLADAQKEIIENAVEFHDVDVAEIMTPRTEIRAVEIDAGVDEAARAVAESGHGRIPVFEGNLDAVVGVVVARDVIRMISRGKLEGVELPDVMRPAVFVPETKLVSELLQELRRDKQKMAIVLDEYGGTAGLVTMGDILAEIVGDMHDEFDEEEAEEIRRLEDGAYEVSAAIRISEVNEELELELPEEADYETLAGFVLAEMGRFPKAGEAFMHRETEFTVAEANDRRVLQVRIRKLAPQNLA